MAPTGARAPVNPPASAYFIAIGASGSDGLDDIKALLAGLPDPLSAIVLVALHRPWDRLSHLRDILARASHLPVVIAVDGDRLQLGTCYIGEPAEHLTLAARAGSICWTIPLTAFAIARSTPYSAQWQPMPGQE